MLDETVHDLLRDHLQEGRTVSFKVRKTSMIPTLVPGDVLVVKGFTSQKPSPGTLLVVRNEVEFIAHRLLRWGNPADSKPVLTKGDQLSSIDPGWDYSSVWGIGLVIQRGDREIDLSTDRSRLTNRWIAWLSGFQATIYSFNRVNLDILVRMLRKLITLSASLGYWNNF